MISLPALAAVTASLGWATGIVLAQRPAQLLGAFEFTRIQLLACAAIMAAACFALGLWPSVTWHHWPAFLASAGIGIVAGNLAMIACLRRGGPRRTELLLSLKAVLISAMAYVWLGETPTGTHLLGGCIALSGVYIALKFDGGNGESDRRRGSLAITVLLGVAATACQGFGFLVMKPALLLGTDPLAATAIRLVLAALMISVLGIAISRPLLAKGFVGSKLIGQTILPGFIGYGVASSLLLYAIAHMQAGVATVLGSLSPVLVLPILWLTDKKAPTAGASIGAFIAVLGTTIIFLT
ncbi:MAG: DMT family transporter [Granulosicoccaceae bacterium]